MIITRRIPARTEKLYATWCKIDFLPMSNEYRTIRSNHQLKLDKCHVCGYHFENGEMMALAAFVGIGNRTLCRSCATSLLESSNNQGSGNNHG